MLPCSSASLATCPSCYKYDRYIAIFRSGLLPYRGKGPALIQDQANCKGPSNPGATMDSSDRHHATTESYWLVGRVAFSA